MRKPKMFPDEINFGADEEETRHRAAGYAMHTVLDLKPGETLLIERSANPYQMFKFTHRSSEDYGD